MCERECVHGIPVVRREVTLKSGGLVGEPDQGTPGVQDLLHPDAAGPELLQALADHGEDALGGGPLGAGALHLVLQGHASFWLSTEKKEKSKEKSVWFGFAAGLCKHVCDQNIKSIIFNGNHNNHNKVAIHKHNKVAIHKHNRRLTDY